MQPCAYCELVLANTPFELTPLKVDDSLYLCTPHDVMIALDADTGKERWRYDPKVDTTAVVRSLGIPA